MKFKSPYSSRIQDSVDTNFVAVSVASGVEVEYFWHRYDQNFIKFDLIVAIIFTSYCVIFMVIIFLT